MFRRLLAFAIVCFCLQVAAQQTSTVPRLIRFSGTVAAANGTARTGVVGVMFSLYSEQQGGTALWTELQNVTLDANGQYTVLLGSQHSDGVPPDLFTTNEARWLGIQIEAEPEQARVLLVSVPYALKAGDAETLGGKPLSAFLLNPNADTSATTGTATKTPSTASVQTFSLNTAGSGGTANFLAKWTDATTLGNAVIFDNGTNVGIGTTTPAQKLEVDGNLFMNASNPKIVFLDNAGAVDSRRWQIFAGGNAFHFMSVNDADNDAREFMRVDRSGINVTQVGFGEAALSAGSTRLSTAGPRTVYFDNSGPVDNRKWQMVATGGGFHLMTLNDAENDAREFMLVNRSGVNVTGVNFGGQLSANNIIQSTNGGFKFPDNTTQTTAGIPFVNSCTNGNFLGWNGAAWVCAAASAGSGTVTGVTAGNGLRTNNVAGATITTTGTLDVDPTKVPLLASANTFTANQSITGNSNSSAVLTVTQSGSNTAGVFDNAVGGKILSGQVSGAEKFSVDGTGKITATALNLTTASAGNAISVTNTATTGVVNAVIGVVNSTTNPSAGVLGESLGTSGTTFGVEGIAANVNPNGVGVQGVAANFGVRGFATDAGSTSFPIGVNGQANNNPNGIGVVGSGAAMGVKGNANINPFGIGVFGTGAAVGVKGVNSNTGFGVYGFAGSVDATGVFAGNGSGCTGSGPTAQCGRMFEVGDGNNVDVMKVDINGVNLQGPIVNEIPNDTITGTALNRLVKLTPQVTGIVASTGDQGGIIGIATYNAGTQGNAIVAFFGQANCQFDNQTTFGDYLTIGAAGQCHDAGPNFPPSGQVLGRVISTNTGAGTPAQTYLANETRSYAGKRQSFSALGFTNWTGAGIQVLANQGRIQPASTGSPVDGYLSLDMADGSTVSAVTVCGTDNGNPDYFFVNLKRKSLDPANTTAAPDVLGTALSGTNAMPGPVCVQTPTITNGTIDKNNYVYYLELEMSGAVQVVSVQVDH